MTSPHQHSECLVWSDRKHPPASAPTRILVVDDELDIAEPLGIALADAGLETRYALDGVSAVALLDVWSADVVVLDISMPVHDGFHTAKMIRTASKCRRIAIVAHTAFSEGYVKERALETGFDAYCQKGNSLHGLLRVIEKITQRQWH